MERVDRCCVECVDRLARGLSSKSNAFRGMNGERSIGILGRISVITLERGKVGIVTRAPFQKFNE